MAKMAYFSKDSDIPIAEDETESLFLEEDLEAELKAEFRTAMKTEVEAAVEATRRELLQTNVEKTLRDIFLDGYKTVEGEAQNSSYQFIKHLVTHIVAADTLELILASNFDKCHARMRLSMQ